MSGLDSKIINSDHDVLNQEPTSSLNPWFRFAMCTDFSRYSMGSTANALSSGVLASAIWAKSSGRSHQYADRSKNQRTRGPECV
ncbi:unnamed protein product [Mycena citricolor]|uniref:Uncharacterized protein n=1 Tax=Mycena citricolor TaxID=2018698 RepID=A0AAD2H6K1_9AGAR|nr:unnamed protein product [Mycena citricolor]